MIRSDGVVKLMDFGISHMVDLERLTVTGQLLGSPAYMAPEHVEGRPLDFRTDVFAAGIVLYQLHRRQAAVRGQEPARGAQADRRVQVHRSAPGEPAHRQPARPDHPARDGAPRPTIATRRSARWCSRSRRYLEEIGIATDKLAGELARYFQAPASYEQALKERLVDHLTRRGQKLLADDDRPPALDVFDRVLTIDPDNEKVIAILDGINRRARLKAARPRGCSRSRVIGARRVT